MYRPDVPHPPRDGDIRFEITPNDAFIDEDVRIRLSGLAPHQHVQIRASTEDDDNRRWISEARFVSNDRGEVDLATQESTGGTYRGVAPMGLFWSMRLAEGKDRGGRGAQTTFTKRDSFPHSVRLEAQLARSAIVCAQIERSFRARGTALRDIAIGKRVTLETSLAEPGEPKGHVGRLFLPPGQAPNGKRPAVIILSGSGGGFDLDKAAVLSRHGFAALALAYFGAPPLPAWLHRIPLEYIESAVAWLAEQPEIDSTRIGALGVSRGAELALLAASRFPVIRALVCYAPSSVTWDSGGREKNSGESIPAWTWRGEPVPSVPLPVRRFMWRCAFPVLALRRPVMFRNLFRAGMRDRQAIKRAAIPVEQISGPILLVSGGDDHVWPAEEMAHSILDRLQKYKFQHQVEHLHYPAAGHLLRYPHLPTTARESGHQHLHGARFSFGGTPQADAEAQTDAWRRAIKFLRANLCLPDVPASFRQAPERMDGTVLE